MQENLLPPIDGGRHHSHSSYYESISPPPTIQEQEERRSSSVTPNSGSAGKVTPTSPNAKAVVITSSPTGHLTAQTGSTSGRSGMTSSEIGSPVALPPFYSPEGSTIQPVQSGPYLDPPAEFSTQNTSSPTSRQATSLVAAKPHPPVNGDIRCQQIEVSTTPTAVPDQHVRQEERERSPFDIDQPLVLANSNGNNSSDPNCRVIPILPGGYSVIVRVVNDHQLSVSGPNSQGLQKTDTNFPSRSSILTHSDNAEIRSSMESGFDADNELESTTAWYLSPDSSPKQDSKNPRPKLGPQVEVIIGSPVSQQNKGPPSTHSSTNSTSAQLAHYPQYSGTASDMQSLESHSQRSREGSVSEYDRLQHDRPRQQKSAPTPLHEDQPYYDSVEQRRGSVPGMVGYGHPDSNDEVVYSEAYPVSQPAHKASRSFDCADILNERLQAGSVAPRFMSPPPLPQHTAMTTVKAAHNHVVLFNGHSPTPGAPLSPVTPNGAAPPSRSNHIPGPNGIMKATKQYDHLEKTHSRSCSQPEDVVTAKPSPLSVPQPTYANTTQLPARSHHSYHHHHHHHHYNPHLHRKDRSSSYSSNSSGRSGHRRYHHEQSVLKSSYPGHYKGGHTKSSHHRNSARSHHHGGLNGRIGDNVGHHSPSQLQAFSARATDSRVVSSRTSPYEGSQESYNSGQGTTPEATPTLTVRQPWTSGSDSGFDSMQRDGRPCAIVGASTHQHFHSGVCVSTDIIHTHIFRSLMYTQMCN